MRSAPQSRRVGGVLGIDGCRGGWVAARTLPGKAFFHVTVHSTLEDLYRYFPDHRLALIDIPMGLLDKGPSERECDRMARRLLPGRKSAVFRPPVRRAVYSGNYAEASEKNRKKTGYKISRQTWGITPKIREADIFMRRYPELSKLWYESHPELCFHYFSPQGQCLPGKRTPEGIRQRLAVLSRYCLGVRKVFQDALADFPRKVLAADDVLDALALAAAGLRILEHGMISLPPSLSVDAKGLPMRIVVPNINLNTL